MKTIGQIGSYLKRIYRIYSVDLLKLLQERGYLDLRASFLEILMYVAENDRAAIKDIGAACGLKKQTMTSHLNELEKRGYVQRVSSHADKRESLVSLTENGERFKVSLFEVIADLEEKYIDQVGQVEMERLLHVLTNFYSKFDAR